MKTLFFRSALGTVFLLALTTGVAWAWPEQPFARIDISGPGINGVASVTDPDLLKPMTIGGFMDFSRSLPEPQGLGEGYELHRYFLNADGSDWDFDRVMYYADPAGGPGYVKYLEGVGYGPAHNAGLWFRVTPEGEAAMQNILQSITAPVSAAAPQSAPVPNFWPIALTVALAALLALGGLMLQRRPKPVISQQ
jgi:hypothetical protein